MQMGLAMRWLKRRGLDDELDEILETRSIELRIRGAEWELIG